MMFEIIFKDILPLVFSLIAVIISLIAIKRTKTREDKIDEENVFGIMN